MRQEKETKSVQIGKKEKLSLLWDDIIVQVEKSEKIDKMPSGTNKQL